MEFGKRPGKGQAAIEYLSTYGWAILFIAIIGVVLWQMSVFNLPSPPPDCRGFSQIRPADWVLKDDGNFTMVIVNEANTKLYLSANGVTATIVDKGKCTGDWPSSTEQFLPGASKQVYIDCSNLNFNENEYYQIILNVSYTNVASGMQHNSVGKCWGSVD